MFQSFGISDITGLSEIVWDPVAKKVKSVCRDQVGPDDELRRIRDSFRRDRAIRPLFLRYATRSVFEALYTDEELKNGGVINPDTFFEVWGTAMARFLDDADQKKVVSAMIAKAFPGKLGLLQYIVGSDAVALDSEQLRLLFDHAEVLFEVLRTEIKTLDESTDYAALAERLRSFRIRGIGGGVRLESDESIRNLVLEQAKTCV